MQLIMAKEELYVPASSFRRIEEADASYLTRFSEEITFNVPDGRKLDLQLTLRHASGPLFQEVHSELGRSPRQPGFFGLDHVAAGAASVDVMGTYYTPPAIARLVAEIATQGFLDRTAIVVLDPACGSGSFLIEAAHALRRNNFRGAVRLVGYDVSDRAIEMARFALSEARLDASIQYQLSVKDFLSEDAGDVVADVVVINPPFGSYGLLSQKHQQAVSEELGSSMKYRPDLSQAFVSKAVRLVRQKGCVGTLLPVGVLGSKFGSQWRSGLMNKSWVQLVALLGAYDIFKDATVSVACVILRPGMPIDLGTEMIWAEPNKRSSAAAMRAVRQWASGDLNTQRGAGWSAYSVQPLRCRMSWTPVPNALGSLLPRIERSARTTAGDLFVIELGIRAGNRSLFIVDEHIYEHFNEIERKVFRPIAEKDGIRSGRIVAKNYIFYPDRGVTVAEARKLYPTYYAFVLAAHNLEDGHTLNLARARRNTMAQRNPCIVSRAFASTGAFAVDAEGNFVVVQGYAWRPRQALHVLPIPLLDLLSDYSFIFNSNVFMLIAREYSIIQAGGQIDLAQRLMKHVPLPNLANLYNDRYDLADMAQWLRRVDQERFPPVRDLDQFARAVYGIEEGEWPDDAHW